MRVRRCLVIGLLCSMFSFTAFGQRITGSIDGRVTDISSAVLPGVEVTVTNDATGQARSVVTNETGLYNVPLLPSGKYTVEASLPGFRTEVRRGIQVEVDRSARVEMQLQVGDIAEKVEVMADAPLVQVDSAALGQVIDSQRVAQLPLNGRHFLSLASLTPGVIPNSEGSNLSTQSGSVNVNGARERFNNFMLDGIDNNDSGPGQLVIVPAIDSIQEFKVQTSTFSAEYGRAAGGLINVSTKSGSNSFHGSAFEFLRNSAMDARNFFDNPNLRKPTFKRNQFGASLGGPIAKNKTFLFGSYERTVIRQPQSAVTQVPPVAWRNGDFSSLATRLVDPLTGQNFPGNIIPQNRINPIGKAMLDVYPLPNVNAVNNLNSSSKLTVDQDTISTRLDHQFSNKDSVFVRYSYWNQPRLEPYARNSNTIAGFGVLLLTTSHSMVINQTHVFSPNVVNELRLGYARLRGGLFSEARERPEAKALALPGTRQHDDPEPAIYWSVPLINVAGYPGFPNGGPQDRYDNMYDYLDSLSWTRGTHRIKIGGEYRKGQNYFISPGTANGSYTFQNRYTGNAVADLLLGYPTQTSRTVGYIDTDSRTAAFSAYFQDDWRISAKLTLNLGLRYDYQSNSHTPNDRKANFDTQLGIIKLAGEGPVLPDVVPVLAQYSGLAVKDGTIPRSGWLDDRNNFAPRIGFAYDVSGTGKTVIRGGGGVFFWDQTAGNTYGNAISFPFVRTNDVIASTDPRNPNLSLNNPFPAELVSTTFVGKAVDLHMRTSYMIQENLSISRQLDPTTVFESSYSGTIGKKLPTSRELNAPRPGPGSILSRRPYPKYGSISQMEASGSSSYYGLQSRLDRRLAHGVSVLAAHTWSKCLDDETGNQDPYNQRDKWGLCTHDRSHFFTTATLWELPVGRNATGIVGGLIKGWQVNGIYTYSAGQPYTATLSADNSLTGTGNNRPDLIGQWRLDRPDPAGWVNKAAFAIPPLGTYGNEGRNILRGPQTNNLDFAMFKSFPYKDNNGFAQFRAEVFNIPNHPQFFLPNARFDSAQFGTISRARDSRQLQLSLRLSF